MEAMLAYAQVVGSPARGAYHEATAAARTLDNCRRNICRLLGDNPVIAKQVIFTLNTTDAMNLAIHGIFNAHISANRNGAHAITTTLDHNSALRPLTTLCQQTQNSSTPIEVTHVGFDTRTGLIDVDHLERAMTPATRLVAVIHASNVTGIIQPNWLLSRISKACKAVNAVFLLDAAQSLGHVPIDVQAIGCDLLAFPGHKGLLGPTGTGGLWIRPGIENQMATTRQGGTGWKSELPEMPTNLPDRFEPGSHNTLGLFGLEASTAWLLDKQRSGGIDALRVHEIALTSILIEGLSQIKGVHVLGSPDPTARVGVVSFVHDSIRATMLAQRLETDFGILCRAGLHCAPLAHDAFGTLASGAARFSVGPFTTAEDCRFAVRAVAQIAEQESRFASSDDVASPAPLALS
jgi:cysteine desulfurase / selenocysteine lyase